MLKKNNLSKLRSQTTVTNCTVGVRLHIVFMNTLYHALVNQYSTALVLYVLGSLVDPQKLSIEASISPFHLVTEKIHYIVVAIGCEKHFMSKPHFSCTHHKNLLTKVNN